MFARKGMFLICWLPAISCAAVHYNNILWIPVDSQLTPYVSVVPFKKDTFVTGFTVPPVVASSSMKAIVATCVGFPLSLSIINTSTQWIMFPDSAVDTASKVSYSFDISSISGATKVYKASDLGGPAGYTMVAYGQLSVEEDGNIPCVNQGVTDSIQLKGISSVTGKLKIDSQYARPGHYRIPLDMAWGFEQNKFRGQAGGESWKQFGALLSSFARVHPVAEFDIISSCSYSTEPVELSHGTISLKDGETSYQSKKYPLTISCDRLQSNVSISLKGMDAVSGKTANYTRCGDGGTGVCRLSFDTEDKSDLYNDSVEINGSEKIQIKSDYYPGSAPQTGRFKGNAVMTINVM